MFIQLFDMPVCKSYRRDSRGLSCLLYQRLKGYEPRAVKNSCWGLYREPATETVSVRTSASLAVKRKKKIGSQTTMTPKSMSSKTWLPSLDKNDHLSKGVKWMVDSEGKRHAHFWGYIAGILAWCQNGAFEQSQCCSKYIHPDPHNLEPVIML
jgi:hypothetical protein